MISIGRLAAYAGVTVKTVRHYHARGLLPEPGRDGSGYRRYTAEDAVALVKITTLARAGVPLARIPDLLDADPDTLAAAIDVIDRGLQERVAQLNRTRTQLARLRGGDRLFVPPDVADYLDGLRALGVSERYLKLERDGWVLLCAASPEHAAAWIGEKLHLLADPAFRALCVDYDAAFDWSPDDPRLPPLADRVRAWSAGRSARPDAGPVDPTLAQLVATSLPGGSSPAWDRLVQLVTGRGPAPSRDGQTVSRQGVDSSSASRCSASP